MVSLFSNLCVTVLDFDILVKGFDFISISAIKSEQLNKTDLRVIKLLAASLFFSYFATILVAFGVFVMLIINKRMRAITFSKTSMILLSSIVIIGSLTSTVYKNALGIVGVFGIVAVLLIGQYISAVISKAQYTHIIDFICSLAPIAVITTVGEFIILLINKDTTAEFRCGSLFYLHPNYLGTLAAVVAMLCIYRFYTNEAHRLKYILSGVCCLVCIVLTGSMFAYIEMTVSALIFLICCKKWRSLIIFSVCIIVAAIAVYFIPELIPRLDQADGTIYNRFIVWDASFEIFKQSPLFGQGVLAYRNAYFTSGGSIGGVDMYYTSHAHNILIDSLINFGIIGTGLFIAYFATSWKRVATVVKHCASSYESALVFGILAGTLAHGIVDVTLTWIQTGLLFIIVISCCGFLTKEKAVNNA